MFYCLCYVLKALVQSVFVFFKVAYVFRTALSYASLNSHLHRITTVAILNRTDRVRIYNLPYLSHRVVPTGRMKFDGLF